MIKNVYRSFLKSGVKKTNKKKSQPISRVLSWTVISLGCLSPNTSSDLPEPYMRVTSTNILRYLLKAPIWSCSKWGFPCRNCYQLRGALLPHLFTLTICLKTSGGLFSVALSVNSRFPGITWHFTLRSPDFPPSKVYFKQRLSRPAQAVS